MLAEVKVFPPSQKCFQLLCRRESSCLQGRVVATGRWLCQCASTQLYSILPYSKVWYATMSLVWYNGLWWLCLPPPHNSMLSSSTLWYPSLLYGILPSNWYGTVSGLWWLCFPLPTALWYPLPAMVCYHQFGIVQ